MPSERFFQYTLIILGLISTALLAIFFYRELYPEYRIYQQDFIALEKFRSSITHQPISPFKEGVKQIVIEREDKGPPVIDRCISCHVALQIEDFSPTRIARDLNGNIVYDPFGVPQQEPNPNYIWKKLDEAIQSTTDIALKEYYESLKVAHDGEHVYNVEKVLQMHPLMGRETRPFEFHPIEEYGCTSCHGGNGRGLVTDRAHGPVFDEQYEKEATGFVPRFLEKDEQNDPAFAHVFNAKPGHRLLFQTTPIYPGALIQAKCMKCHQTSIDALEGATSTTSEILHRKSTEIQAIQRAVDFEIAATASLLDMRKRLKESGYEKTLSWTTMQAEDYTLPAQELEAYASQVKFLKNHPNEQALQAVDAALVSSLGDLKTVDQIAQAKDYKEVILKIPLQANQKGTLFEKIAALHLSQALEAHVKEASQSYQSSSDAIGTIKTDVDLLTKDYQYGQELFISQACYACHRIAGFARGGVGPELTKSGDGYPWYVKESIVWPQADLKTSTMPNMRLDHEELEALTTYLLGQTSTKKAISETSYRASIQEWEAGKKRSWEQPISAEKIQNLDYGMTIFAVEGCASCHRLRGYQSDVGFKIEKENPSFEVLEEKKRWFEALFPENILGSQIVKVIQQHREEIEKNIDANVRENSILEKIEKKYPEAVLALYSNFKFASRAMNRESQEAKAHWQETLNKVLKMYVQIYGLGRLICPKPSWAGVYRSDEWLFEHFKNPSSHVPRSIMPAFPFDDSKFYALTNMLDRLAIHNVKEDRAVWQIEGFNPERAFHIYCSQCHGDYLQGNGPVSEWIYPIPKNLKRAEFLRNLTKQQAINSITHGVKGTPMPSWGELPQDKPFANETAVFNEKEIRELVDWIFSFLPGGTIIRKGEEVPKWQYTPEDVFHELINEGNELKSELSFLFLNRPFWAALEPTPNSQEKNPLFDQVVNPYGPDPYSYYIKQKYYTPENIEAGKRFFIENCSTCHGKEADGSGLRAEAMYDAKPRMLTNLDWISSRDDLRLLRSIKYGVAGTSMTAWGDLTSSLQRLQLVIFIRSLSQGNRERREVTDALYKSFSHTEYLLQRARAKQNSPVLAELIDVNKKQKELLFNVGMSLLNLNVSQSMIDRFIDLVSLDEDQYQLKDERLIYNDKKDYDKQFNQIQKSLLDEIDQQITDLEKKKVVIEGQLYSTERTVKLNTINGEIASWKKEKARLISHFAEFLRLNTEEKNLMKGLYDTSAVQSTSSV